MFEPLIPMLGEAIESYGIAAVFFPVLVESIFLRHSLHHIRESQVEL